MDNKNFYFLLRDKLLAAGNKPFLQGPGFSTLTYAQCEEISGQLANLFGHLGLGSGDRVLVRAAKSPMALLVYLACLRSGVIYVPVNPACTEEELAYFLADTKPALFIGDEDYSRLVQTSHGIESLTLDDAGRGSLADAAATMSAQCPIANNAEDDIAVLIYTSGTTGAPKGAMLSHGNLAANARTLYAGWGWSENDILLHCLPIFHVHGLFVATHLALLGASTMIFLPRFDVDEVLQSLDEATVFMGVPTYYTRLLADSRLDKERSSNMRLFVSGSAPLLEDTFNAFRERTGHTILERYGMSETGMLTSNPLDGERLASTVGFPLEGVEVRLRDDQGAEIPAGEIGVLQVKGPNVFSGYWGKPELNRSEFQDGFFITGDLVQQGPDGRISIVGRNKDLVISGGLNIYPKEIESVLDLQEGIRESAAFGLPHPDFGEGLVAAIVPEDGVSPDVDGLMAVCREKLAAYKNPKTLIVLNELPRNTMGKVQKNRLREEFADLFQS